MPELRDKEGVDGSRLIEIALEWFTDYLSKPNPRMGREGAVCPFVAPAMKAGTLRVNVRSLESLGLSACHTLIEQMVDEFTETNWDYANPSLHALVVVLKDLAPANLHVLDDIQALSKPSLAERGLMLGQFHQLCTERAARNPSFEVARAPIPMLAMRRMSMHDILFLGDDARCFRAYRQQFGDRYLKSRVDKLFVELYEQARKRLMVSES